MAYTRNLIYFLPIADEHFIITRVFRMIYSRLIYYLFGYARQEKLFFWVNFYSRNYFFGLMVPTPA